MTVTTPAPETTAAVRRPERRRILQLVLGIALYFLCQAVLALTAILVFATTGSADGDSATVGEILAAPGPAAPIGFAAAAVIAVVGFVLIVRFGSGRPVHEFAAAGVGRDIGWGVLIGAGVVAASLGILGLLGVYRVEGLAWTAGILAGLAFGIGPAIVEEVFFRGILLRLLDGWLGSWAALAIVSVLFALVHAASSPAGPTAAVWILLSSSLLLNTAWFLTRTLWLPIALHAAFNATQGAVFGLNVSGSDTGSGLVVGTLSGPDLLTGGALGGEGSIVLVAVALAAGIVMTVVAVRRGVMLPRAARVR